MSRRNLYDVYKGKEKILSVVTAGQIEEKLGVKSTLVCRYSLEDKKTREGYRFVNTQITINTETQKTSDDWRKEWDEIRFKLNPKAKR